MIHTPEFAPYQPKHACERCADEIARGIEPTTIHHYFTYAARRAA